MRKLVVLLFTAVLLGGVVFAQEDATVMESEMTTSQWFGASTGFPLGIVLHYGIDDLITRDIDLRINLSAVTFLGESGFSIAGGADALYNIPIDMEGRPFEVYAGGGLNVGVSLGDNSGVSLGVRGLGGLEYFVTSNIGAFVEARVGVGTNPLFRPSLAVGLNYHF